MLTTEFSTPTEFQLLIFDLGVPGAKESLDRHYAAWGKSVRTESLGWQRVALIVRPGGAKHLGRGELR